MSWLTRQPLQAAFRPPGRGRLSGLVPGAVKPGAGRERTAGSSPEGSGFDVGFRGFGLGIGRGIAGLRFFVLFYRLCSPSARSQGKALSTEPLDIRFSVRGSGLSCCLRLQAASAGWRTRE